MAMGDLNAVEVGQASHVLLGLTARAFSPWELLTTHGRAPRGKISAGIMIDDAIFCEQRPGEHTNEGIPEGQKRLEKLMEEYLQQGLMAHPKKTFKDSLVAEFWGVAVNGATGIVRPSPKRLIPLLHVTAQTARLGLASVGLLEVLSGWWVAVLQIRRRLLSLLEHIYVAQRGREQTDIVKMSVGLRQELWLLVLLGSFALVDLRAQSIPELFLSDASEEAKASVKTSIPAVFARELQRHCITKGAWHGYCHLGKVG